MSYRAVLHSDRKGIIRGASRMSLDGCNQYAIGARFEQPFVLCLFFRWYMARKLYESHGGNQD
eukprot:1982820-Pyramimonas_sp.AAC.1